MRSPHSIKDNSETGRSAFCWLKALLRKRETDEGGFGQGAQAALDRGSDRTQAGGRRAGSLTRVNLSLADLLPGECGYIARLTGEGRSRLRLLEMGLTPGTHVQVTRAAAFGGPLDISVRGYQLSLRRDEAACVWLGEHPDANKTADIEAPK